MSKSDLALDFLVNKESMNDVIVVTVSVVMMMHRADYWSTTLKNICNGDFEVFDYEYKLSYSDELDDG